MAEECANIIKNIKYVSAGLFLSLDIKAAVFSGEKSLKALDPKLLGLLKKPSDSQYTQLSPILFANPNAMRGNELLKTPVLVKVTKICFAFFLRFDSFFFADHSCPDVWES